MSSPSAELRAGTLPIGVVIPCRNAAPYLERHLDGLNAWLDLVQEVVIVDSASTDGTVARLRAGLKHPAVRFFDHPPGLYPSWNHGIRQVRATYTYVATVGDTITREGLLHLFDVAQRFGSDVVLSPPRFAAVGGRAPVDWEWPIHRFLAITRAQEPRPLSGGHAVVLTALMAPAGILGSSASNLYRTDVLRSRPFPAEFGACGDTAWALMHGLDLRWAVTPRVVSDFLVHNDPTASGCSPAVVSSLRALARAACRGATEEICRDLLAWDRAVAEDRAAGDAVKAFRRRGITRWLRPATWRARSERKRRSALLAAAERVLLDRLRDANYGGGPLVVP